MQHAFQLIEGTLPVTLPSLASATDVRELVLYLKKKPAGITVVEASDAIKKRLFDPRKVAAYELWGIIAKTGDRLQLTELGLEFANVLRPEAEIYRLLLDRTPPYRAVLNWIYEQDLDLITFTEIINYWNDHFPGAIQEGDQNSKAHVDTFLHLCQAAEIGLATVGRKGQPSRLSLERGELAGYIEEGTRDVANLVFRKDHQPDRRRRLSAIVPKSPPTQRVFISAPHESKIVNSVRNVLGIAELECEVVNRDAAVTLVAERTCEVMRRCNAGIIVIDNVDHDALLIEIGAALVHFGRRLVLLCDRKLPAMFHTDDLCRLEFGGSELTSETGLQIVKTLKFVTTKPQGSTI